MRTQNLNGYSIIEEGINGMLKTTAKFMAKRSAGVSVVIIEKDSNN